MFVFLVVTLAAILIAVIIIGLNPLWLMNAMAFSKTVKRIKDLPYANDSRHNLDIYITYSIHNILFIAVDQWKNVKCIVPIQTLGLK